MPVRRSETAAAPAGQDFLITRVLDAPRALVFRAWTQPTELERRTFEEGRNSMQQGFSGTWDQLAAYLAKELGKSR